MAVAGSCKRCGTLIEKTNARTTVKKYCSAGCRDSWWNEKRATGATWGERCDERFGVVPPLELSEAKAMWLAGVVDGEGTIGLYRAVRPANKSKVRYYANVEVCGTHAGFIQEVANTMGGFFTSKNSHVKDPRRKPCYAAKVQRRYVRRVLNAIRPYLIIKGEQADTVLKFLNMLDAATNETFSLHREFEEMYQRMKVLNKRGTDFVQADPTSAIEIAV